MKVIGIVAEYNPLHKGHAYQLDCAKKRFGADAVVVVMSGCFTQRGTPAVFDKNTRAQAALACGADLIIELPVIYSTASAEIFAKGAVSLLHFIGITDELLFGCETEDLDTFLKAASALTKESAAHQALLRSHMAAGNSYAKSKTAALTSPSLEAFLSTPNNLLGTEYIKTLQLLSSPIRPRCLRRKGSQYHDTDPSGNFISAAALREMLKNNCGNPWLQAEAYVPEATEKIYQNNFYAGEFLFVDDVSLLLHERLYAANDFSAYSDCNETLSHKIIKHRDHFVSFEQFSHLLKSKDITLARIRRVLCHILLDIKKEDTDPIYREQRPPYIHLLGFSEIGASLLPSMKKNAAEAGIPMFLAEKEADGLLSEASAACRARDLYAANLYRMILTQKTGKSYPTEFTKKYIRFDP